MVWFGFAFVRFSAYSGGDRRSIINLLEVVERAKRTKGLAGERDDRFFYPSERPQRKGNQEKKASSIAGSFSLSVLFGRRRGQH